MGPIGVTICESDYCMPEMQRELKVNIQQRAVYNEIKLCSQRVCAAHRFSNSNLLIAVDMSNDRMLQICLHCSPLLVLVVNNKLLFPTLMTRCNYGYFEHKLVISL